MRIAIIGAGVSGRLLALNLHRRASSASTILMFDRGDPQWMGPAYSNPSDYLLLNVPAVRMGAVADDPEHFLRWVQGKGVRAEPWDFLPRALYRDYMLELLAQADGEHRAGPSLEHRCGAVADIEVRDEGVTLQVDDKGPVVVDKAVLALGNFPPRHPSVENRAALQSRRYVRNPWEPGVVREVASSDTVVAIGTGQTTVDLIVALAKQAYAGRIVAISRRGILPLAHSGFESYPSFFGEIEGAKTILDIFRAVRAHCDRAESAGIDVRSVIDSMRPDTQALWFGLPEDEKRRFLRHLFRYWEIIRARIPQESEAIIQAMRASGQLEVIAGRIRDLVETESALEVFYTPRGASNTCVVRGDVVINCIGPESDYSRIDDALVQNLVRRGLIRPGPAGLGLDARPDGAIIGRDDTPSNSLFTLGSPMKGVLWEVLGVPDIRAQAERLAERLISEEGRTQVGQRPREDARIAHPR